MENPKPKVSVHCPLCLGVPSGDSGWTGRRDSGPLHSSEARDGCCAAALTLCVTRRTFVIDDGHGLNFKSSYANDEISAAEINDSWTMTLNKFGVE